MTATTRFSGNNSGSSAGPRREPTGMHSKNTQIVIGHRGLLVHGHIHKHTESWMQVDPEICAQENTRAFPRDATGRDAAAAAAENEASYTRVQYIVQGR